MKVQTLNGYTAAIAGFLTLAAISTSHSAIVGVGVGETPGVPLTTGTTFVLDPSLAGAVLADQTIPFANSGFTGSLRSLVVQRTDNSQLDFYYQVANTSNLAPLNTPAGNGADIFRLTLGGFDAFASVPGNNLTVNHRTDGLTGITGAGAVVVGTKAAFSADRDPGIPGKGVGFDFDLSHFINLNPGGASTAPGNVDSGQTSNFLLVRTRAVNSGAFPGFSNVNNSAVVSGAGTSLVRAFAPIPEPATVLVGLALTSFVGCAEFGRSRRRKTPVTKA